MNLFTRVFVAVFCVTSLSVFLAAYLNYAKFESTYTRIESDRFRFVATDIVSSLENELDLGINLARMTSAERVLGEAAKRSRGMTGAIVFDLTGEVLFSTGERPVPGAVPAAWLASTKDGQFTDLVGGSRVLGSQLVNNFGHTIGGVAVSYSALEGLRVTKRVRAWLFVGSLLVSGATMVLCSIGLRRLTKGVTARVHTIAMALKGAAADADTDAGMDDEAQRVAQADAESAAAMRELSEAEARLGRLAETLR